MLVSNADRNFMWPFFADECYEKGIDPNDVDYDEWLENRLTDDSHL